MLFPKVIHNPSSFDYFCIVYVGFSSLHTILNINSYSYSHSFHSLEAEKGSMSFTFGHTSRHSWNPVASPGTRRNNPHVQHQRNFHWSLTWAQNRDQSVAGLVGNHLLLQDDTMTALFPPMFFPPSLFDLSLT